MRKYYTPENDELTFAQRQAEEMARQDYEVARIVEKHQSRDYSTASVCEVNPELRDNIPAILERNRKARQRLTNNL